MACRTYSTCTEKKRPVTNFIDYAVFVSFFPLLVAGPIERADHLLPQVQRPKGIRLQAVCRRLPPALMGHVQKVVIADTLAVVADNCLMTTHTWAPSVDHWCAGLQLPDIR